MMITLYCTCKRITIALAVRNNMYFIPYAVWKKLRWVR